MVASFLPLALGAVSSLAAGGGRSEGGNPANAGMSYLNQIPRQTGRYLNPYISQRIPAQQSEHGLHHMTMDLFKNMPIYAKTLPGPQHFPDLYENPGIDYREMPAEYTQMARTPKDFMENIMRGYEPSRAYQFAENRLKQGMRNTAAAGGFAGTPYHQLQEAEGVRDLLSENMQQYLQNILGIQQTGLGGEERRIGRYQSGAEKMLAGRERHQERTQNYGLALADALQKATEYQTSGIAGGLQGLVGMDQSRADRAFRAASDMANIRGTNLGQQASLASAGEMAQREAAERAKYDRLNMITGLAGAAARAFGGGFNQRLAPRQSSDNFF